MMKKLWIWGFGNLTEVALCDDSGSSQTEFCNYNNNPPSVSYRSEY